MKDILPNPIEKKVLDKGFVRLIDVMPRMIEGNRTADCRVVQAARVSYGNGLKTPEEDAKLLRYLWKNQHLSCFEMVSFVFHIKMPLFIVAQLVRHRTFKLNAQSFRYSEPEDDFYIPDKIRFQSSGNKQGSVTPDEVDPTIEKKFYEYLRKCHLLHAEYTELVNNGVAREMARIGLPQNLYTQLYVKADLRNLLNFIRLRADSHAQWEIQQYANAMTELITPIVPQTIQAFKDFT